MVHGVSELRLEESYRTCRRLQRRHDPTYYWATRCLPRDVQPAVHALYGFVRGADQIVDGPGRPPAGRAAARGARRLAGRARARAACGHSDHPRHRRAGRRRAAPRAAAAPAGALHGLDARRLRGAGADRLARAARRLHGGQRGDRRARHLPAAGRAGARGGGAPGRRLPADELHPRRADRLGPRPRLPAGAARGRPARGRRQRLGARARSPRRSRAPAACSPRPPAWPSRWRPGCAAACGWRARSTPRCSIASRATATTCSAPARACARGRRRAARERGRDWQRRRPRSAERRSPGSPSRASSPAPAPTSSCVDRYEIGARATSACAAPTPWLHAMGVASAIRRELPAMTFTTPHGTVRYRLPWSWSAFDYRELCAGLWAQCGDARFELAKVDGRDRPDRPHRPRRPRGAARGRRDGLAAHPAPSLTTSRPTRR